jgi:hypothetical protein
MNQLLEKLLGQSALVQGGFVLMIAGWLGYQLRALPGRLADIVREWTTRVVQIRDTHPHYEAWLAMLTEHAIRRGGPRTVEARVRFDEDGNRLPEPRFVAGLDEFWARVAGRWCHVRVQREEGSAKAPFAPRMLITLEVFACRRGDLVAMAEMAGARATVVEHRQLVDVYNRYGSRTTIKIPKRTPDTLCLPPGLFDTIERRLAEFLSARDQYERVGLPWRFGVLLSGPPGTGKTSLVHVLASRLGLRIAVITLADIESDHELLDVFRAVEERTIVLIEDIDCAFRQRDGGGEAAAGVSFSGFLNCIDGVLAPHNGRILIMSTNHVDRLDPALIRPGRVDLHVQATTLSRQDAADYADRIFPHVATRHEVVGQVMGLEGPTPAILINRLTQQRWHRPGLVAPARQGAGWQPVASQPAEDDDDEM